MGRSGWCGGGSWNFYSLVSCKAICFKFTFQVYGSTNRNGVWTWHKYIRWELKFLNKYIHIYPSQEVNLMMFVWLMPTHPDFSLSVSMMSTIMMLIILERNPTWALRLNIWNHGLRLLCCAWGTHPPQLPVSAHLFCQQSDYFVVCLCTTSKYESFFWTLQLALPRCLLEPLLLALGAFNPDIGTL